MKRTAILAASVAVLGTAAVAETELTISDIDVQTDLTALENPEAAKYWGSLDADLEAALASRLNGNIGENGYNLTIDVEEVALANAFTASIGLDESILAGKVELVNPQTERALREYDVTAEAGQLDVAFTDENVITLSPDSREFYDALIASFADGVAATITEIN